MRFHQPQQRYESPTKCSIAAALGIIHSVTEQIELIGLLQSEIQSKIRPTVEHRGRFAALRRDIVSRVSDPNGSAVLALGNRAVLVLEKRGHRESSPHHPGY